jgi:hypothetical protein
MPTVNTEGIDSSIVPPVFLPGGKFNAQDSHWPSSYIEDRLYLEMCETKRRFTIFPGETKEQEINAYYAEAAKYAGRISAGDFSGENTKYRPIFRFNLEDFSARLKAELASLPKKTIHRIVTEAAFRIFRARHKMIFYQYIENERLRWEFI